MFHRILKENVDAELDKSIYLSRDEFDFILNIISNNFNVVCLREVLFGNFNPDKSNCIITFDDGWVDNYEIAFPVLRKACSELSVTKSNAGN